MNHSTNLRLSPLLVFLLLIVDCNVDAFAEMVETPVEQRKATTPLNAAELAKRYPIGKKWQSMSVIQVQGTGSSTNWGLQGEQNFTLVNRYVTRVEVLENKVFGASPFIKMRVDVLDAAGSKIITKQKLRWVGLDVTDPIFEYVLDLGIEVAKDAVPGGHIVVKTLQDLEKLDPKYERTLTEASRRLGLNIETSKPTQLEWIEEPRVYAGCSFEVEWVNGFGVTKAEQVSVAGGKPKLTLDNIRQWLNGTDPLVDIYVFPSIDKSIGDKWDLDAAKANVIFSGDANAQSSGKVLLHYLRDGSYNGQQTRELRIESGNVQIVLSDEADRTIYALNSMQGTAQVDNNNGMLLMANGSGEVQFNRLSMNHFLFKAEINRDLKTHWRYEAKLLP